jgi:hypothetical protein
MSREARDWAWRCRGLTPALRCIVLALAEHADEEGRCWPSLTRLAELTEVDRRTVTRGLAELEDRGLMVRERHHQQSTSYTLAIGASDGDAKPRREGRDTPPDATGPGAADPEGRGMTPPHQGYETPRDLTPLGVSDPSARGVTPRGRGVTPPDLGASDPPNRHKNRHRTESEPSLCGDDTAHRPKPTTDRGRRATPIPRDWRPGERVFAWAATRGMTRTWVEAQIDEFLVYWTDTGEARKSWDATFINRLQALQASQPNDQAHEPEPRLADKDYSIGATPLDQIPWLKPAALR